jgi:hypothetical protein
MEVWVIISNIFLGLATIFVGISALWISLSKNKIIVKTYGGIYSLQPNNVDYYCIFIVNKTPNISIKIDNIGFEKIKKKSNSALLINTINNHPINGAYPKTIKYGEEVKYFFTIKQAKDILEKSNVNILKCYFYDTVSNKYLIKIKRNDLLRFTKENGEQ